MADVAFHIPMDSVSTESIDSLDKAHGFGLRMVLPGLFRYPPSLLLKKLHLIQALTCDGGGGEVNNEQQIQ